MKATEELHELGQSIWLDNITREMLDTGQLQAYIDDYSVTGLTSNPSIFDKAIASGYYDDAIREKAATGIDHEGLFFELAIEDLRRAADALLPIHERTAGVDGWVSLEVSPLLAYDTNKTVKAARALHERAARSNLLIKIPGTKEGLPAIEESIAAGVPINVTLLFSADQYRAAADAFMRGIERRIEAEQDPVVGSVASLFMSRWDVAVQDQVPANLRDRLALAVGLQIYRAYRELMDSDRWQRLENAGRAAAAPVVGEHEHERPESARRPLRTGAGSPVHGEHRSGLPRCAPSMTTATRQKRWRRTAATPRRRWRSSPTPASTSTRWPRSSKPTARRASSTPGMTS